MPDFTSALYLGMWHASTSLRSWDSLTLGIPTALTPLPESAPLERRLAELQGCEAAVLAPSSFHLIWDIFGMLGWNTRVYLDGGCYPILRWGAERAQARSQPVHSFEHYNALSLESMLERNSGSTPFVVMDGFCPACGRPAPLANFLKAISGFNGMLLVDDTQAFGILGAPDGISPYGSGGGGSLLWHGICSPNVIVVASLAKAFGTPAASLFGAEQVIRAFKARSQTRVHCSPASRASLRAVEHALALNAERGDLLRSELLNRIEAFQRALALRHIRVSGGTFPVQTLVSTFGTSPDWIHEQLLKCNIRTVLHGHGASDSRLSFVITARHRRAEIEVVAQQLAHLLGKHQKLEVKDVSHFEYQKFLGTISSTATQS